MIRTMSPYEQVTSNCFRVLMLITPFISTGASFCSKVSK